MESILVGVYLICFAVIGGGAFALMTQNLRRAAPAPAPSPEAPEPGEEVLYVDLSRERLEALYQQA